MYNNPYGYGQQQIIKVNGENGANAYQLPPSSSALLLDETAPRLFLAQTDGAGYKTISAYKLEPYVPEKPVDIKALMKRIEKLEKKVNAKSDITANVRTESDDTEIE